MAGSPLEAHRFRVVCRGFLPECPPFLPEETFPSIVDPLGLVTNKAYEGVLFEPIYHVVRLGCRARDCVESMVIC